MSYQEIPDPGFSQSKQNVCVWCCMLVITSIIVIFDIVGLAIGKTFPNATCYVNQNTMSLSLWLVVVCSAAIIVIGLIILVSIFALCGLFTHSLGKVLAKVPCVIFLGCVSAFNCIMNIIGMIELWHQFPSCSNEVTSVSIMSIIIVIFNILFWLGTCFGISYGANSNKKGEYIET